MGDSVAVLDIVLVEYEYYDAGIADLRAETAGQWLMSE